jgi:hypothetical protein
LPFIIVFPKNPSPSNQTEEKSNASNSHLIYKKEEWSKIAGGSEVVQRANKE